MSVFGIFRNEDDTTVRMLVCLGVSTEALEGRLFELRGWEAGSGAVRGRKL